MNIKRVMLITLFSAVVSCGFAQATLLHTDGIYQFEYPETFDGIEEVSRAFTSFHRYYADFFRFADQSGTSLLRVVILPDRDSFETYIQNRIGERRSGFIFLKYAKKELSELVLYPSLSASGETLRGFDAFAGPVLLRQLYLQYLYAHVSEPPLWVRDGFQACFETLNWDSQTGAVRETSGEPWLESAKSSYADSQKRLPASAILSAVTGSYEAVRFYPQAWAFATFLKTTENPEYQRFLYETFIILGNNGRYNDSSLQENTDSVKIRFVRFFDAAEADENFAVWLSGKYTFNELIQFGVTLYNSGEYAAAGKRLREAALIRPQDPLVSYYLGLVAYSEKNYEEARTRYIQAQQFGAEASTVLWALALNAWSSGDMAEAKKHLLSVKETNPGKYGERADKLLQSIPSP